MPKGCNIKRFVSIAVMLAALFGVLFPLTAYADVNNFTITNFTADYYLTNADPQGELRVVENIDVDFHDYNHGILRALPRHYKHLPLNIHISSVSLDTQSQTEYETYTDSNDNEVIKIGDPSGMITGAHEYTINYVMDNVISFYGDHDELYWDINGDQWGQPFTTVVARIHMPAGLALDTHQPVCYTGNHSSDKLCTISVDGDTVTAQTTQGLDAYQTLTTVVGFKPGYFRAPSTLDYIEEYIIPALAFGIPVIAFSTLGFAWWYKRGRDAKGTGVIIPQYDPPDKLSPLEVGTLVDFVVDSRDLTATIIDLAIRKYLKIIEVNKKKLLVASTKTYKLELINTDWSELNYWERQLMEGLFGLAGEIASVNLSDMATKLQQEAKIIKSSVLRSLTDRGYFVSNPKNYAALTLGSVVIAPIVIIWWFGLSHLGPLGLGFIAGGVVLAIFYHFLSARTAKGVVAQEHALGLKLYLEVAEKDRIAMLQSPDARYAGKTSAPEQTVALFEKLLPYAIVLQVEKQWAKKFENIYASPPDWYQGNYASFSAGYLVGSLGTGFSSSLGSSFASASNSSSSGFGGGGFSGGGGGGGGGGGW